MSPGLVVLHVSPNAQANVDNWARWTIHADGLERIVKLRGGLAGLGNQIPLMSFW